MTEPVQDQYRVLFEHSADAMLIIDGGRFIDCNEAALRMLGYAVRADLFATHPSQLSPPFQPDGGSSYGKANEMIAIAMERGSHRFEWIHRKRDGTDFPVEVLLTPIPAGGRLLLHVVWRDITQRKQSEEQLRLAKYVTDSTSEGIIVTDMDLRIIEVNPAYCDLLGYDRDEVLGRNAGFAKSGRHDEVFYQRIWESLNQAGKWQGEIWDRKKTGEVFPIYLRLNTIFDATGRPCYYTGLFSDITHQKRTEEQLEELAFNDALTGLPNRALFHQRLKQELKRCQRHENKLALLFIDLDRFKNINDSLGHTHGDALLIEVGDRIRQAVRSVDTVARMGGDEFTVILLDLIDEYTVTDVATKILAKVIRPVWIDRHEIIPHLSIGISLYPRDGESVDDLTRHADMAMYHAKSEGGDRFHFFQEEMNRESGRRLALENEMSIGLNSGQFVPYFQPVYELDSGLLVGMEALVRWQHPERGLIMPDEFIPLAEETGLIIRLGHGVLQQACRQVKQWMEAYSRELYLAVNLSARQFHSNDLIEQVRRILNESRFPPGCLTLEITESMMMGRIERTLNQLTQLRAAGLNLAIDDFGTGYSSLSYLQRFPVNALKIDRSFIRDILTDRNSRAIVRAIISMARAMELDVIAEGVENTDQLAFLKELKCQKAQGYLFSRPLPADQFERLLVNGD
jgi:diguanylate cyclase (GGDEF)-like protein/PAS domain S-box-containing protein